MECRTDNQREFHAGNILPDASSWPVAKGIEAQVLPRREVLFQPPVGLELLDIITPYLRIVMDGIAGHR